MIDEQTREAIIEILFKFVGRYEGKMLGTVADEILELMEDDNEIAKRLWEEYQETVPREDCWSGDKSYTPNAPTISWTDWLDNKEG